jgi:hypothetical protein
MPPAKTGKDNNNNIAVSSIDQTNKGTRPQVLFGNLIFNIVLIKFNEDKIEDKPAKCKLKIAKSTEGPE